MLLSEFERLPPAHRVDIADGLSSAIDAVATRARESHRFLRYGWFSAALAAYGGAARTLVVSRENVPTVTLPIVDRGPRWLGFVEVPGCYWPFRSFPVAQDCGVETIEILLGALAGCARAIRIGPVYDGDPALELMREAARRLGWLCLSRDIAESFVLDIAARRAEGVWPRASTLKKNRFHEKHLAAHGALDWRFVSGADWTGQMFDDLTAIEQASWIEADTDGSDAKFTARGHGGFWRRAAQDAAIADMMWAAVLTVEGRPTAFSFDLNAGQLKYAIANSYAPHVAKHSPGKLLYYRNLVRAIDDGVAMVDWGAGDSGYKRVIGAEPGPMVRDWLFVRPGLPAAIGQMARRWWERSGQPQGD